MKLGQCGGPRCGERGRRPEDTLPPKPRLPGVLPAAPGVRLPHRGHLPGVAAPLSCAGSSQGWGRLGRPPQLRQGLHWGPVGPDAWGAAGPCGIGRPCPGGPCASDPLASPCRPGLPAPPPPRLSLLLCASNSPSALHCGARTGRGVGRKLPGDPSCSSPVIYKGVLIFIVNIKGSSCPHHGDKERAPTLPHLALGGHREGFPRRALVGTRSRP